ncbi:MAG TPA: adenosine deaminase [Acidobacteriaceae bacterium]|nr:adenosine deaminase [Acidobacteriaceae bacterium]
MIPCCRRTRTSAAWLLCCLLFFCRSALAAPTPSAYETRAARAYDEARHEGPPALRAFLDRMPKGADLHMHLSGAVYAETFLREAGEDHDCVNAVQLSIDDRHHDTDCPTGESPAAALPADQSLYDELIDALSMRSFIPVTGDSGHDHFFNTFARFGDDNRFAGEWIDEVASRAAAQNEQYLELMQTGNYTVVRTLADRLGWDPDLAAFRTHLLADPGFHQNVSSLQAEFTAALERRNRLEHCGSADASPACRVTVRFLYQVKREEPPQEVFAQSLLGFELAAADPDVVGINLVQPEDSYIAMRDYRLQMRMFGYLHSQYPHVHISLHAGELAAGMVPPAGLTFHIRSAVEQGHAERIGHGVDIMFEDHPWQLMKQMADRHIMVEINLTSNAVILNVQGDDHPFMLYRKMGVPVALSTDDEGVSRINLTHEFVRAADTYPLSYYDLKLMVRTSLEHAFLPGDSLWIRTTPEKLDTPVAACRGQLGDADPHGACAALIHASPKAQQEWELERRFRVFESSF